MYKKYLLYKLLNNKSNYYRKSQKPNNIITLDR